MLDQEMASIIAYTLKQSGNPTPYYYEVPENFLIPAAYFPQPEIISEADTLNAYALDFTLFVTFFHKTSGLALELGFNVMNTLLKNRNLIPLIDEDGTKLERGIRIKNPSIKKTESGVAQLTLEWTSRRSYDAEESDKISDVSLEMYAKKAFQDAVESLNET